MPPRTIHPKTREVHPQQAERRSERGTTLIGVVFATIILLILLGATTMALLASNRSTSNHRAMAVARGSVTRARASIQSQLRYSAPDQIQLRTAATGAGFPTGAYREIRFQRPTTINPDGTPVLSAISALTFRPTVQGVKGALILTDDVSVAPPVTHVLVGELDGPCYFRLQFGDTIPAVGERLIRYQVAALATLQDRSVIVAGEDLGELNLTLQNGQ